MSEREQTSDSVANEDATRRDTAEPGSTTAAGSPAEADAGPDLESIPPVRPASPEPLPVVDAVQIEVEYDPRVNFAMQQNDVPLVKRLQITNPNERAIEDLAVRVLLDTELSAVWEGRIARLDAGATWNLDAVDLSLRADVLVRQTERQRARLSAEVLGENRSLAYRTWPVEVLAYNEWGGLSSLPEILAAFVLPNHPAVAEVLGRARELLEATTGDASLAGYSRRDPARVRALSESVYASLVALGLAYVEPPASFESEGQKVRSPDQVLEHRMATCLDLALLAAGCLEQLGLHALVVVVEGHAFVGVWTVPESFPEPCIEDALRVKKRAQVGDLVVFEVTGVTARPTLSFERAEAEALRMLADEPRFRCAIDVHAARKVRVRPLPLRLSAEAYRLVAEEAGPLDSAEIAEPGSGQAEGAPSVAGKPPVDVGVPSAAPELAADALPEESAEAPPPPESARERLRRWKRKLLDLSLRNRLINFRPTKKTLPLCGTDLDALEDALADGRAFGLLPRPSLMEGTDPRDPDAHRRRTGEDAVAAYLAEELADGRLHVDLTGEELERRALELYRTARSELEESGANTLYLALGFLRWYETTTSTDERRAPILLLPLELERLGPREGYRLRFADEDARVNVTLLEKLRTDYQLDVGGLAELPTDEHGVDVPAVFQAVRRAILPMDRWDLADEAVIGLFSFTKFLMWLDLEARKDALLENAVVRHLVERPDEPLDGDPTFPDPWRLDDDRALDETYCPLDADSSQLAAVFAGRDGKSFVLEGPPGTGKSQTIANLVAQLLADGRRVLFVSEKMAALDVVHRRLAKIGLEPFCLELHSSKAHKREVLAQLGSALDTARMREPGGWEAAAAALTDERAALNRWVDALHRPRAFGSSVYEVTAALIGMRDTPAVPLDLDRLGAVDDERLEAIRAALARLTEAARPFDLGTAPLRGIRREEWATTLASEVESAAAPFVQAAGELDDVAARCARDLAVPVGGEGERSDLDLATLELLLEVAGLLATTPGPTAALVTDAGWEDLRRNLAAWVTSGRERDERRARLHERWSERFEDLDLDGLLARTREARASMALLRWWRGRSLRRELAGVARERVGVLETVERDLEEALDLRAKDAELAVPSTEAARLFGPKWKDGHADWTELDELLTWTERFRKALLRVPTSSEETARSIRQRLTGLATAERDQVSADAPIGGRLRELAERWDALLRAREPLAELLDLATGTAWPAADAPGYLAGAIRAARGWVAHARDLRGWCHLNRTAREVREQGLGPLVDGCLAGEADPAALGRVFERSFFEAWLNRTIDGDDLLRRFTGVEHEGRIEHFRELDHAFMDLTARALAARLASRVPQVGSRASDASEVGVLQRQLRLSRRHMPIRKLLAKLPHLTPRLKPCFLMSPLSVAQYLDPGMPSFDVVVFDEASQIPVWDAVGAIARGAEVIVVGDSKQLPPTTFFQKLEDEDTFEEDDFEELESVLDECVACGLPRSRLSWHYRSRHESLIAFSNHHYYDGGLQTFPSPVERSDRFGVTLRRVAGVYDKGGARTNRGEAEAVVAEIVARAGAGDPRRIGVVTFSLAQQRLVEDLLDAARIEHPVLAALDDGDEPLFVKNLENVQGDERDVILFSVGYGPDANGRFAMNFGPLNREGGERRLNVAVTRAREQVLAFASFDPGDIDLTRTRATGVRHLKAFLEYAARGPAAIGEATGGDEPGADQAFGADVRARLEERGWSVDERIGCSGYRIDLAVRDPEREDRYLLGIECDGPTYRDAATARDRDRLRTEVLRGLGWELCRLWSAEWWLDRERELERLETAIRAAAEKRDTPPAEIETPRPPDEPVSAGTAAEAADLEPEPDAEPVTLPGADRYDALEPEAGRTRASDFYAPETAAEIGALVVEIVVREGPIHSDVLVKRVATHWGLARVTGRVQERVIDVVDALPPGQDPPLHGQFYWPTDSDPQAWRAFRLPGPEDPQPRKADEVPPRELANAAEAIVRQQISLPAVDLARELARAFGFQRMSRNIQACMDRGIQALLARGGCVQQDERVVVPPYEADGPER